MISVAMIIKDEVKTLRSTVETVRPFVDEIVIGLDNASSDGTDQIVEELADKVIRTNLNEELAVEKSVDEDEKWGFEKARNRVLDQCKPDNWRLTLDGHETVLSPQNMSNAIETARTQGCDGVELMILFEPNANGIPSRMFRQGRLFAPSVRYNNALHNVPVVNKTLFYEDIEIEHRKQLQDAKSKLQRDRQRSHSTIEGFLKDVRENPGHTRSWFYLGNAYRENAKWTEAIDAYKQYLKIANWNEERWHARANMGECWVQKSNFVEAREQYVQALEEFPGMVEAYYCLANLAYKQQRFREAQAWLEFCVDMPIPQCRLFVNPMVYLFNRYDLLSMVYHHMGRYEDAIATAKRALVRVTDPRVQKNIAHWGAALEVKKSA